MLSDQENAEIMLSTSGDFPLKMVAASQEKSLEVIQVKSAKLVEGEEVSYEDREREMESIRIEVSASLGRKDLPIEMSDLDTTHKQHWRPFDHQKAVIASIVSVLKPGAANTSSIAQDNWICVDTIKEVNEFTVLSQFLKDLLELPERQSAAR